ncbi:hypothetical protein ABEB36_011002 [Hypothenemus hampei]|uniref:Protein rolling stone n=1 Tax=Hypothenemus hampei TaxID=57062 RepID=A0ABD1EEE9_HYPHA
MLGRNFRKHLTLKPLRLQHDSPTEFIVSQWQHDKSKINLKYCVYRVSIFIIFFVSWIFTYLKEPPIGKPRWPIYLTNWGFTLIMLQNLLNSIMLIVSLISEKVINKSDLKEKIVRIYPVYWAFNIISTPVAFTISIIYWTLIFGAEGATFTAMNFIVHGLNSIITIIDLCVVCHPIKIFHFIYPLLFALSYTIFTIIFYIAGGTTKTGSRYIYPILKWDQPGKTTGICAGVMGLMIVLHLFTFGIYRARIKLFDRFVRPRIKESVISNGEEHDSPHSFYNKAMAISEYI